MAKALGAGFQKEKALEDIFKSLTNSSLRITLMMTALQKYQNMTLSDAGLIIDPRAHDADRNSTDEENASGEALEVPCLIFSLSFSVLISWI